MAEDLGGRAVAGRDVFPRGMPGTDAQGPAPLADVGLFKLLDAFQAILDRAQGNLGFEVTSERISIQERMTQITDFLRERRSCSFEDLFVGAITRYEVVVTFLALLEMTKMRVTRIYQSDVESPIHVQYALLDASDPTVPPPAMNVTSDQTEPEAFAAAAETALEWSEPESVESEPEPEFMPEAEPEFMPEPESEPLSDAESESQPGES